MVICTLHVFEYLFVSVKISMLCKHSNGVYLLELFTVFMMQRSSTVLCDWICEKGSYSLSNQLTLKDHTSALN